MSDTITIPKTLREKYTQERERLYELIYKLDAAIIALASGNVASYSLGNRSCTYTDLDKLKGLKQEAENKIEEIEAILRGASPRNITVSSFLDPSICIPRW
jgi:hypothetical protein